MSDPTVNGMREDQWNGVYQRRGANELSWLAPRLETSLRLIHALDFGTTSRIIDVGGGASTLVDNLLFAGFRRPTVLNLADDALEVARWRLGESAKDVQWLVGDITRIELPAQYDLWHDRAVFDGLLDTQSVAAYVRQAAAHVARSGFAVLAGFAPGCAQVSAGHASARRSAENIAALLAPSFELIAHKEERHRTPSGDESCFLYAVLVRQ